MFNLDPAPFMLILQVIFSSRFRPAPCATHARTYLFGRAPSSATGDGGVCDADRHVRSGQGVSRAARAGLPSASGGGHYLGADLHDGVHAVRHGQDARAAGVCILDGRELL